ncbi:hypothetical protein [Arenimonas fontis]|uniref:hypothetical protein n=1 Tax=Arenimonas fontis TaxID=2608255 RepID=UPI001661CE4A|nr:hypothetical protein [Arenimonas fontis]
MSRLVFLLLGLGLLLASPAALGQAMRVDDSASQVLGSTLKLAWDEPMPGRGGVQTLSGTITVQVRLNVRPWKGQRARIYQVLQTPASTRVHARWSSQGRLLPGQLRGGERALVYAGLIDADELQDVFQLTIVADGDGLEDRETLNFDFEIELENP